nr:hypothetical protein [Tanacetum cinerariifolium]
MEKGTRSKLIRTAQLEYVPELIHRIQKLLPVEEAACTCILSKSWLHAWSTIPTVRFPPKPKVKVCAGEGGGVMGEVVGEVERGWEVEEMWRPWILREKVGIVLEASGKSMKAPLLKTDSRWSISQEVDILKRRKDKAFRAGKTPRKQERN